MIGFLQLAYISVLNLLILDNPRGSLGRQRLFGCSEGLLVDHLEIYGIHLLGVEAGLLFYEGHFPEKRSLMSLFEVLRIFLKFFYFLIDT